MSNLPPGLTTRRILKEDQLSICCLFMMAIALVVSIIAFVGVAGDEISLGVCWLVAFAGSLAFFVLAKRICSVRWLIQHGLVVEGQVDSMKQITAPPLVITYYYKVYYHFYVRDIRVTGCRAMLGSISSRKNKIWLLVSPQNYDKHFVVQLSEQDKVFLRDALSS